MVAGIPRAIVKVLSHQPHNIIWTPIGNLGVKAGGEEYNWLSNLTKLCLMIDFSIAR